MQKKMFRGIITLVILIIGACVVLLLRDTDTEPTVIYNYTEPARATKKPIAEKLSKTEKFKDWFEENKATLVSDESEQVKDNLPDEQKTDKFPDWHSLTPKQQKYIADRFYTQFGLKVPPRGYDYVWKDAWVPELDENGNPILRRLDEPVIKIRMGIGFAPTKEQFEKYEQLKLDRWRAEKRDDVAEIDRLTAEIDALEESAQRMRPLSVGALGTTAEHASKSRRMAKEKFNAALREHGLEHLIRK